ncbi:membrane-anchored lipid-binding protein YSP2 isoform X3 [Drosophila ficusphila]|uniref:membrane-anchored lipid-binding protein YSP2 isoform X3 n=1 Tax=Drosophila ficusphila TaxID=30025 RepID=UPI0007E73995|nr:membrane-anchored lipid-binding protein YSP2 isoform X3 [Drosophila ficusphila]
MHFVTQQRAQQQHHKSSSSSSSSLASCSGSGSGLGSGSGFGSGSGSGSGSGLGSSSRFGVLRKSSSQGALPKSLATAHSFFHRPSSSQSKHKRTASLNVTPMIKDSEKNNPTTSSVTISAATAESPSGSQTPANANMIPETTQPDQLQLQSQSQSQLQTQTQSQLQSQSQSQFQSQSQSPSQDNPDDSQQPSQPKEEEQAEAAAGSSGGDRRDSITEEITITSTTTNSSLSTKLLTIQEAAGSLEQSSVSISTSSRQSASPPAGESPSAGAAPGANESSGSNLSLTQAGASSSPPGPSSTAAPGATPSINIVSSESSKDQPQQPQSVDSNGFIAPGGQSDSPGSRKSSTSSKGKTQAKLSTSSSGRDEQDISHHRLSDLTQHELSLLRVDREQQVTSSSSTSNEKPAKPSRLSERAKKKSWYNVIYPNYKSRAEDFKKLFKDVPNDERLIVDYSCALQRDILVQGRLYVSQNYVCFHANIFSWETYLSIKWKDVTAITKEKTALVIPNAISIASGKDKYFFATFTSRDKSFLMLFRVWQNTLMNKQFSPQEIWKHVHTCYGEELGLTTDDEDYIDPTLDNDNETDFDFQTAIDDDSQSQRQSQQSNQSTQSNPPLPQSGNSSASSGGGVRASAPRKSKTKYFFNSSKSSANASASGSDNNKTRESSRKLNKKMKQNAKELTLSSVKPTELSVSVTMSAPAASSSSTAGSTTASSSTIVNHAGSGSGSGSMSGSNTAAASGSGSEKKAAEKKVSTGSNSAALAAVSSLTTATSGTPSAESKIEAKRKLGKMHRQREDGINAAESVPTDVSDSSDSEENNLPFVPTTECTSTHEGRQIVHTILPINVDTLFNLLFSKSKFITDFHAMRKSTDLVLGEWTKNEEGLQVRTVNVTVQLAASVGPKTSKVTEYQTQRECSKPGELYSIDVNSVNAGIPYADSFSVLIHFCLARTVDDHTMLSIHTQIKYKKSIWGVVKGFIEKNTWAGLEDFFGAQLHALQSETCIPPAKGKGRRPRRGMNQQSAIAIATSTSTSTTATGGIHTATSTDNDSIQEALHHPHQQSEHHQHQHLHMHHHHHHHHGSQHHQHHHHHENNRLPHHHHHQPALPHHHHHHQHPHWHHRKAILQSSRGTATQIRPLEEPVGPVPAVDPLEAQMLTSGGVPGAAVGAAAGHPLLLEGGTQQQLHHLPQQSHHHLHHLQPHKQLHQQQQLHLGGADGQPLASGHGSQGHRLRHKGLWLLVILLLFLMLALNVILLLKLWKLEERIDGDLSRRARLPSLAALSELPSTNQEWLELLRDQEMAHENELQKWQQVLQTAIELLKKTEKTLAEIIVR